MVEGGEKTDAVADNSGVDGADIGVDKGVGVKCFRKDAICGGPMTKDGKKGGADPDKIGVDGANLGVEKGVGVKCCRKDANCGGPMIEGGERAGAGLPGQKVDQRPVQASAQHLQV